MFENNPYGEPPGSIITINYLYGFGINFWVEMLVVNLGPLGVERNQQKQTTHHLKSGVIHLNARGAP